MTIKEPVRGRFDAVAKNSKAPNLSLIVRHLWSKPSFWMISLGAACSSMMGYGLFFWLPSFFVRSYGMSLLQASLFFGAILLVGGIAGLWLGGSLGDKFGHAKKSRYLTIPATAFLVTVPFYLLGILSPTLWLTFVVLMVPTAMGLVWLGPVISVIQHLVPPDMRATASAVFLFINNLIGIGIGTWAIGALSDGLVSRFGDDSLRYSILAGTIFYVIAAALFFLASRWLERDWEQANE